MTSLEVRPRLSKDEIAENKRKWKTELIKIKRQFANKWIYRVFRDWGSTTKDSYIPLHSNINLVECVFIDELVRKYRPVKILEIGCAMGTSGMIFVNALQRHSGKGGKLVSVDPFQDTQWGCLGVKNIKKVIKLNVKDNLLPVKHVWHKQLSSEFWASQPEEYDMVFIDGDHSYEGCKLDILGAHSCLKVGGLMVLDDIRHSGPSRAISHTLHGSLSRFYKKEPRSLTTMAAYIKKN